MIAHRSSSVEFKTSQSWSPFPRFLYPSFETRMNSSHHHNHKPPQCYFHLYTILDHLAFDFHLKIDLWFCCVCVMLSHSLSYIYIYISIFIFVFIVMQIHVQMYTRVCFFFLRATLLIVDK